MTGTEYFAIAYAASVIISAGLGFYAGHRSFAGVLNDINNIKQTLTALEAKIKAPTSA